MWPTTREPTQPRPAGAHLRGLQHVSSLSPSPRGVSRAIGGAGVRLQPLGRGSQAPEHRAPPMRLHTHLILETTSELLKTF